MITTDTIYADLADLLAYDPSIPAPEPESEAEAALQHTLWQAEMDVDALLPTRGEPDLANLRTRRVEDLDAWDREVLRRAVCAQAVYRRTMGPQHFTRDQYQETGGPGGLKTVGRLARIGPQTAAELDRARGDLWAAGGLRPGYARAGASAWTPKAGEGLA